QELVTFLGGFFWMKFPISRKPIPGSQRYARRWGGCPPKEQPEAHTISNLQQDDAFAPLSDDDGGWVVSIIVVKLVLAEVTNQGIEAPRLSFERQFQRLPQGHGRLLGRGVIKNHTRPFSLHNCYKFG